MKGHPLWTGIVHINPDVEKFRIKPMKIPENGWNDVILQKKLM